MRFEFRGTCQVSLSITEQFASGDITTIGCDVEAALVGSVPCDSPPVSGKEGLVEALDRFVSSGASGSVVETQPFTDLKVGVGLLPVPVRVVPDKSPSWAGVHGTEGQHGYQR